MARIGPIQQLSDSQLLSYKIRPNMGFDVSYDRKLPIKQKSRVILHNVGLRSKYLSNKIITW